MSVRTCLLCGKPLGRIWVGAGDDFCSREHGNQYRLKRGMDRLTEANKISSLMRRRESPRPITSASQPLDSASARRDYPEAKTPAAGGTRFPSLRPLSVSSTPRIAAVSEHYVPPRLRPLAGSTEPRPPDSPLLRFPARKTAPLAPAPRVVLPARIPRARAALLRDRILRPGGEHRGFGAVRHAGIRGQAGLDGIAPSRIELPGAACFLNTHSPREIEAPQKTGKAQGLSRGFGFRRPARRGAVSARPLKARAALAGLAMPARQFLYVRKTLHGPATPRAISRGISTYKLVFPSIMARVNATGIQGPSAARIGKRRPCHGTVPAVREWGPQWNISGLAGFPHPRRLAAAPERGMPTPCLVALPLAPVRANGAPHVTLAPFAPQNSPFGYKEYQEK
jgi:hypothetical protein